MLILFIFATFFYFTNGIITLKHSFDLSGYCKDDSIIPITKPKGNIDEVSCRLLSNEEIFHQNYFVWTVSVFVGMQFTHLSRSTFFGAFDFVGNIFAYWPLKNYFILAGIAFLVVYSFNMIFNLYVFAHVLYFYIGMFIAIVVINFGLIEYLGVNRFHLHHYLLGQTLLFFACF